jgi:hypothetical protein
VQDLADHAALDAFTPPALLGGCQARVGAIHDDEM